MLLGTEESIRESIGVIQESLRHYRDVGRPFETHNVTTLSWNALPHDITPVTWFVYYRLLESTVRDVIVRVIEQNQLTPRLYIHGNVFVPFNLIPYPHIRMNVYRLFAINTPHAVFRWIEALRYRLFFVGTPIVGDRIMVCQLRLSTEFSAPTYRFYDMEL